MSPLKLQDFAANAVQDLRPAIPADDEVRLAAYEEGYTAGWEDASAAQAETQSEVATAVAQHLQTLTFGYQDARRHVLLSLQPLLLHATEVLLPEVAKLTLPSIVAEALVPLAQTLADAPVTLRLAPSARMEVERHLAALEGLAVVLVEDDGLTGGQVFLESGPIETQIDLDAATAAVTRAVRDFLELQRTERHDE